MSKRFMVVGTSNDVPDNQIRMCGIFEQEFENGEVVYAIREPITHEPIKLTVNNDITCIADEPLKMYGCIVSHHTAFALGLDIGLDTISIISEKELLDFRDNVICGRRLTDQESSELAYAESMKTYTFDESFKEENNNDKED